MQPAPTEPTTVPSRTTSPRARRLVRAFPVLAATAVLAGCGAADTAEQGPPDAELMGHIHGIGVDPADDTVYVGAHYGVFRLDGDTATRIADRWQDTMSFTVVGENHFLASGHPALDEDLPTHLGLIESTDAGETWTPRALQGDADFHALEPADGVLYGFDSQSGEIYASEDWTTFRRVGRFNAFDLAADPTDPTRLMATTPDGIALVDTSNATSSTLDAPALAFLDWPRADTLVGLAPDGRVYLSPDQGRSWTTGGRVPGEPSALEVSDDEWFAATSTGLYRSADDGSTWDLIHALEH